MSLPAEKMLASFRAKVRFDATTGCLNWIGEKQNKGYGVVRTSVKGKRYRALKFATGATIERA